MKCAFCGYVSTERELLTACTGCAMTGICRKVKCVNCGYEVFPRPRLPKRTKEWRQDKNDESSNGEKHA